MDLKVVARRYSRVRVIRYCYKWQFVSPTINCVYPQSIYGVYNYHQCNWWWFYTMAWFYATMWFTGWRDFFGQGRHNTARSKIEWHWANIRQNSSITTKWLSLETPQNSKVSKQLQTTPPCGIHHPFPCVDTAPVHTCAKIQHFFTLSEKSRATYQYSW